MSGVPGYTISFDRERMDVRAIHAFLTTSYWARGISPETVERSIAGSLECVGAFDPEGAQVGFARAIGDGATFAWIADVYVLEGHRGRGVATWIMRELLARPSMRGLRRVVLATRDAHRLYEGLGFRPLPHPERWMALRPSQE